MAKLRLIPTNLWRNVLFSELDATNKLLYLYLYTCKYISTSGIFSVSIDTISTETKISPNKIKAFFESSHNIFFVYDFPKQYIWIKQFIEQSKCGGNPNSLIGSISLDYNKTPNSFLWELFFNKYPQYKKFIHKQLKVSPLSIVNMFEGLDGKYYKIPLNNKPLSSNFASHRALKLLIASRDNFQCKICGGSNNITLDHIYPLSLGGTHHPSNLQTACKRCNSQKSSGINMKKEIFNAT